MLFSLSNFSWGQNTITGVTTIVHGFTPGSVSGKDFNLLKNTPSWMFDQARAILDRNGGGTIYESNPFTGIWSFVETRGTSKDHIVLLYNWVFASWNISGNHGELEACADNLFGMLMNVPNVPKNYFWSTSVHKHFIGHSRGAVLLTQVFYRALKAESTWKIQHFTTLDPHPATPMGDETLPYVSTDIDTRYKLGLPSNVLKADNYFRMDESYEGPASLGAFDGVKVDGTNSSSILFNNDKFQGTIFNQIGYSFGGAHSNVHMWYYGSINTSASTYDGINIPSNNWYGGNGSWYLFNAFGNFGRNNGGYKYSKIGGGYSMLPNALTIQPTTNYIPPKIFNGNFQWSDFLDYGASGWNANGGKQERVNISNGQAEIYSGGNLKHSLFLIPSAAKKIVINAKCIGCSNSGQGSILNGSPTSMHVKFYNDKFDSQPLIDCDVLGGERNFYTENNFELKGVCLPDIKGKLGTFSIACKGPGKIVINNIYFVDNNNSNLRESENSILSTNSSISYFDFPVTYNVNPTPLIKGVRPSSFNATIQNTLPSTWNGTLTMTWRKVTDIGKGIPLVSKGVSLAPNATVTLDRGTQEIISEAGDYVLSIYANNDNDPIDRYYFYVVDPDEVVSQSVSISPSSSNFGFGNVLAATTKSQTFTITNTSNTNVGISGYSVTGTGFTQGTANTGTILPNQSKTINVQFQPTAVGAYNGNLQISGTFDGAPLNITLSGTGYQTTPPVNGCLESSVSSVNIITGNTNAPRQQFFTLSNTSQSGSVTVNNIQFTGADAQYFSYDTQLFSTPTTINKAISTGFMVKVNGSLTQNRNYTANLNFTTNNSSCPTLSIPVVAINQNSSITWVAPLAGHTAEYITSNGYARFELQWQGYVQGATPIERAVQIQYSIAGGAWTHVSQSSIDCTKGHSNDQINTEYFDLTDANSIGKKVQFRIKPCNTNVPWQYTGIFYVIEAGFKPLQVISPNGYEVLTGGTTYDIKWKDLLGYSSVNLFYSTDNGNTWISIANNVSGEATYYRWNVPSGIKNSNCLVRITGANISDDSDITFTIQPPLANPIAYSDLSISPIGCGTTPNGSVNFRLLGGQPPYNILFVEAGLSMITNNTNYATGGMSGLDKGFHTVIITDANLNKASYTFYVPEKREYTVKPIVTNDICSGSKGSISVNLIGDYPFPPVFTFSKNGQQLYTGNNGNLNNLSSGLYSVQVKDSENCINEQTVFVDTSPGTYFPITPTVTNTGCGGNTGAISLNVGTAQTPTFLWSNGATTQNLTALGAGQYSVNITDGTGCVQKQKYEVFEDGGLVETIINYAPRGAYNNFKINQGKLYFNNYKATNDPTHSLGILDISTNAYSFIQIPSLYNSGINFMRQPKTLDVTDTDIYTVVDDGNGSISETHFVKISKSNNLITNRKSISGQSYYAKIQFINGKLYALRIDKSMDIVDFANNTTTNFVFPDYLYNFVYNSTNNKLYLVGDSPQIYEYDPTSNSVTRTGAISINRNYQIHLVNSSLFITGYDNVNQDGINVESFDLSTFVSTGKTKIRNQYNIAWGRSFVKNNRYLYMPSTLNYIDIFDTQLKTSITVPITTNVNDIDYEPNNDKILIKDGGSKIIRLDNNKFDYTTSKTDITCGINNGSITLTIPNDGKTYTYLWSNGATTKDVSGLSTGSYTVTVTQTGGCAIKKTIEIVELSSAFVASISPNTANICPNTSLSLISSAGQSYVWYKDNIVISGATSQTYNATLAGNYKVIVTNSNNCTASSNSLPLTVIPNPVSNFTFTTSGNTATFTNTSTNGSQYLWSFGDNTTDTQFSPIKTFSSAGGTFNVKLRTTNTCGNFNEITKTVTISCTQMYTVKSGNWNDATVWSCGRIPTSQDNVTIKATHNVYLNPNQSGYCKNIATELNSVLNIPQSAKMYLNTN